ncbi:MAG: hypothetical protein WBN34_02180 [Woeseia sp.]
MLKLLSLFGGKRKSPQPATAAKLLAAQNFSRGTVGAILAAVMTIVLWVFIAMVFDRYFPWVSMLQGIVIGIAMQRGGSGLDWRFPTTAAVTTAIAAVAGSFFVALFLTGREFNTGALALVDEISLYTVETFLLRDFGTVGLIYMAFAAALAAFFANRRLLAGEAAALRRHMLAAPTDNH